MKFFFLLLFIPYLFLFGQNNLESNLQKSLNLTYAADIDYYRNDYKASLIKFKKAFRYNKPDLGETYLNVAATSLQLGKLKLADYYIRLAITEFLLPKSYVLNYDKFETFKSLKLFKEIDKDYVKLSNDYYKNLIDIDDYKALSNLIEKDQLIRVYNLSDSVLVKEDSLIINRYMESVKKYGISGNKNLRCTLFLWHQRDSYKKNNYIWNFFKPIIDKGIKEGDVPLYFWTEYEDDHMLMNEQKQIYGTFSNIPIKDIDNVDKRRTEKGLPPLLFNKLIYGLSVPDNYKLTEEELFKMIYDNIK